MLIRLRECNGRVIPVTGTVAYVACCEFYSFKFYGGALCDACSRKPRKPQPLPLPR